MDATYAGIVVAVATPLVGVIYWLSKLEGKVEAQQQRHEEFKTEVRENLIYIRSRIDRALDDR